MKCAFCDDCGLGLGLQGGLGFGARVGGLQGVYSRLLICYLFILFRGL